MVAMCYISRFLGTTISDQSKTFKVIFLGGPRQVGKTTLLRKLAQVHKFNYVTLDDINLRELANTDPSAFLHRFQRPLVIDEIQYAPSLLPIIKKIVDESGKNGQYWLTGSQQFELIRNMQESLAGRVGILNLLGLSRGEIQNIDLKEPFFPDISTDKQKVARPNIDKLFAEIFTGGFPVFQHKNKPDRDIYFNSYLQTYIDRDLVDIFGITKTTEFNRFVQVCAARTSQVLNISDMARDSGVSVHAAKEWLNILESSNQIYLLQPYFANFTKRLIKSPKLYFLDTGFAAYLTRWNSAENVKLGSMAGPFFETYALSEIIKSFLFRGKQPPIYYFRDKEGHEVDLIIEESERSHLVEFKLSNQVKEDHRKGLNYLGNRIAKTNTKTIVSLVDSHFETKNGIQYLPYTYIN